MESIVEYLKSQAGVLIPAIVGVAITLLTSERHSFLSAVARVASGLFCAIYLTDPILEWMRWNAEAYRSAVAGLLAINGFQLVKFFSDLNVERIIDLWKRAGKK